MTRSHRILAAVFTALVALAAGPIQAQDLPCDQQCQTFYLGPHSNICLPSAYAPNAFNACGTTFGHGQVNFSVWQGDPPSRRVTRVISDAFFVQLDASNTQGVFPGVVAACVHNPNAYGLYVNLCQEVRF